MADAALVQQLGHRTSALVLVLSLSEAASAHSEDMKPASHRVGRGWMFRRLNRWHEVVGSPTLFRRLNSVDVKARLPIGKQLWRPQQQLLACGNCTCGCSTPQGCDIMPMKQPGGVTNASTTSAKLAPLNCQIWLLQHCVAVDPTQRNGRCRAPLDPMDSDMPRPWERHVRC